MNFLDIILIILILVCVVGGIVFLIIGIMDDEAGLGVFALLSGLFLAGLCALPFLVVDKASGSTTGTITSVDKNFFGTTAVYIKTTETNEEEYCIEFDEELEATAKSLIGKKVKITYGKRVGLYSTGKCSEAPIETIEMLED